MLIKTKRIYIILPPGCDADGSGKEGDGEGWKRPGGQTALETRPAGETEEGPIQTNRGGGYWWPNVQLLPFRNVGVCLTEMRLYIFFTFKRGF